MLIVHALKYITLQMYLSAIPQGFRHAHRIPVREEGKILGYKLPLAKLVRSFKCTFDLLIEGRIVF